MTPPATRPAPAWRRAVGLVALPARELLAGLDAVLASGHAGARLATVFAGLAVGWFLYVPAHELLHAAGCRLAGGSVSRLEIAPLYGGELLARLLPFVVAGGAYAGRLSGFETHGSDAVYLATDLAPFVLTLVPGVWLWRRSARRGASFLFGCALPLALAPFLSLPGDGYEIGSILTTRLPPWSALAPLLRGDDVVIRAGAVAADGGLIAWSGLIAGQAVGLAWALVMYALGASLARLAGQPPLVPSPVSKEIS